MINTEYWYTAYDNFCGKNFQVSDNRVLKNVCIFTNIVKWKNIYTAEIINI